MNWGYFSVSLFFFFFFFFFMLFRLLSFLSLFFSPPSLPLSTLCACNFLFMQNGVCIVSHFILGIFLGFCFLGVLYLSMYMYKYPAYSGYIQICPRLLMSFINAFLSFVVIYSCISFLCCDLYQLNNNQHNNEFNLIL